MQESNKQKPGTLYKFCHLLSDDSSGETDWHLKNLFQGQIFFNDPQNFNDPFDSDIAANYEIPEAEFIQILAKKQRNTNPEIISETEFQEARLAFARRIANDPDNPFKRRKPGVSCFSEKWDSTLMWGHYTSQHHGYCLEFDTGYSPFSRSEQIRYSLDRPIIQLHKALKDPGLWDREISRSLLTKHEEWRYEKEWRLLSESRCSTEEFDKASLKSVIIGMKVTSDGVKRIKDALSSYANVQTYRCEPVPGKFALQRTPLE